MVRAIGHKGNTFYTIANHFSLKKQIFLHSQQKCVSL